MAITRSAQNDRTLARTQPRLRAESGPKHAGLRRSRSVGPSHALHRFRQSSKLSVGLGNAAATVNVRLRQEQLSHPDSTL